MILRAAADGSGSGSRRDEVTRFVFIIGGSKVCQIGSYLKLPQTKLIVVDNGREVAALRKELADKRVAFFVLAPGETSRSLAEWSKLEDAAFSQASGAVANMSLEDGMGSRPKVGHRAAERTLKHRDVETFFVTIADLVSIIGRGRATSIEAVFVGSSAGGSFSGAAVPIARAFEGQAKHLAKQVVIRFDVLGPIAFAGLAKRARTNDAASRCGLLAYVLEPVTAKDGNQKVIRQIVFHESEPCGDNREKRELYLSLEAQALLAEELVAKRQLEQCNDALTGPMGNVNLRQTDLFAPLDQDKEVISQVAKVLSRACYEALEDADADSSWIAAVDVHREEVPLPCESTEAILARAHQIETTELIRCLSRKSVECRLEIVVHSRLGGQYFGDRIADQFSSRPASLSEMKSRIQGLKALRLWLQGEIEEIRDAVAGCSEEVEKAGWQVARMHGRLLSGSRWFRENRFAEYSSLLREVTSDLWLLGQELAVYESMLKGVEGQIAAHEGLLRQILEMLERSVPSVHTPQATPGIVVKPMDEVFSALCIASSKRESVQRLALAECVAGVTRDGLARIVGSNSNRVEDIVHAAIHHRCPIVAPPPGGSRRQDEAERFYVFPPCHGTLRVELDTEMRKQLGQHLGDTAFAASCGAGLTVARIDFWRPEVIEDLFSPLTKESLRLALQEPLSALNFTVSLEELKGIGIQIVDGQVSFT